MASRKPAPDLEGFLLISAGIALVLYPALRPYGSETGASGARDLASSAWAISHALGMLGFVCLAAALRVRAGRTPLRARRSLESVAWLSVVLLLPYYGAEAFGLNAVGRHAVEHGSWGILEIADDFRYSPLPMLTFGAGLVALGVTGDLLALQTAREGRIRGIGAVLTASALVLYLPQFFTPGPVRIAHGLILGVGLVTLGLTTPRSSAGATPDAMPNRSRPRPKRA
jgi:hypothetical protein